MTHDRYVRWRVHPTGQLTPTRSSDVSPDPDGVFKEVVRVKIRHYRNLYLNHPDPIAFLPLTVDTSGRIYDDFLRLMFLHVLDCSLDNELPEESDQFRFLLVVSLSNLKDSVGLILAKTSDIRISGPLDLSSRSFRPLSCFIRSRCPIPLLRSFPCPFSSTFCLSNTCWTFIWAPYRLFCSSYFKFDISSLGVYYESIKRELQRRLIYEYRCHERLKTKTEESTCLSDTGLVVELEHLKTKTSFIDKKFASVRGECEI